MTALLLGIVTVILTIAGFLWWACGKRAAAVAAIVVYLGLFAAGTEILSRAKPAFIEWRTPETVAVIAYKLAEGAAIWLWLDMGEPRSYALPWDSRLAQQLIDADKTGQGIEARNLFRQSWDHVPMAYPRPQPMLPPKPPAAPAQVIP